MSAVVYCADVGSVAKGNFGWARAQAADSEIQVGRDINELVTALSDDLTEGRAVALGFECPLWVPLPVDSNDLGKGRPNEGSPPWSGGPGGNVLATGVVQVSWVLRELKGRALESKAGLGWEEFTETSGPRLLIWEAFVSGKAKAPSGEDSHTGDALIGVRAFLNSLPDPVGTTAKWKPDCAVVSLAGMCLLLTGWSQELSLLNEACLVVKAFATVDNK